MYLILLFDDENIEVRLGSAKNGPSSRIVTCSCEISEGLQLLQLLQIVITNLKTIYCGQFVNWRRRWITISH